MVAVGNAVGGPLSSRSNVITSRNPNSQYYGFAGLSAKGKKSPPSVTVFRSSLYLLSTVNSSDFAPVYAFNLRRLPRIVQVPCPGNLLYEYSPLLLISRTKALVGGLV